ncbi:hypothetical protein QTP88_004096 [Uroleucon formosanum]
MKSQPLTEFFSCGVTLTVKHLMTECRLNKEERIRLNIQTNLYEIIGPDCQPENSGKSKEKSTAVRAGVCSGQRLPSTSSCSVCATHDEISSNCTSRPFVQTIEYDQNTFVPSVDMVQEIFGGFLVCRFNYKRGIASL